MPSKPSPNSKSWYFPGEPNTPTVLPSSPLLVPSLPVTSMLPSCPSLRAYQGQASLLCSVQLALTQDSDDALLTDPVMLTDPVKTLMTLLLLYSTNNPCPSISNHHTVCSTIIYDSTSIPRSVISTRYILNDFTTVHSGYSSNIFSYLPWRDAIVLYPMLRENISDVLNSHAIPSSWTFDTLNILIKSFLNWLIPLLGIHHQSV